MIIDIITKKKNNQELTKEEISYVIGNYMNGNILDYQMSSLLMAIVLNGMTDEEVINLTDSMLNSGEIIDLSEIEGHVVDKHSTGGVGDKTSLVLGPLVAACGVKMAKMSGRGLGVTGGTIDKLESIKGFKVEISKQDFVKQINEIGIAITSQTGNVVPADKKIYALRDVTGTTESIPLIASSIMSKKIASGADSIIIDVKVGNGALMKDEISAQELANLMIKIGKHYNKSVKCVLTSMEEPLGNTVGNGIEVIEAIDTLKGKGPKDLEELVLTLGSLMISDSKKISIASAKNEIKDALDSGLGYEKFKQLVKYQGGDIDDIEIEDHYISIKSPKEGYIERIDTYKIGDIVKKLGGGRMTKDDIIDYGVGIDLSVKVGDLVLENEELLKIYIDQFDICLKDIIDCFTFNDHMPHINPLIIEVIE